MITLPRYPRPNRMGVDVLDFGFTQRGASSLRVERPGGRHRIILTWPRDLMTPDNADKFLARLKRGKRQGVQIDIPCANSQSGGGNMVVNGAGQSGTTLAIRSGTPDFVIRENFWFTVLEADGTAYLHSVVETVRVAAGGTALMQIEPPLRAPFPDGARVEMARPFVQGELLGETFSYAYEEMKKTPLTVTIEEYQ